MMTLDEAIRHCEEKIIKLKSNAITYSMYDNMKQEYSDCIKCAEEHEQLAEWLKELRDYEEGKRTCENCKHQDKTELDFPCSICRCNHPNKFEWKEEVE